MSAAFASSAFAALPQFTLDPTASSGSFTGAQVTADNVIVSNYSTVRLDTTTGSISESGFLSVQNFQLGGSIVNAPDLNSSYGLYIQFTGTGSQTPGDPTTAATIGDFDSLEYTLYGFTGSATFGFDAGSNPTVSGASDAVALATGSLIEGNVFTTPTGEPFTPGATAIVTFTPLPSESGFFASPVPFFSQAFASFVNTASQVATIDGGFTITQGGGAYNFAAAPIPEPQTYALMLAGLAAMGFVVRRRSGT
jgi:hypothetical protein